MEFLLSLISYEIYLYLFILMFTNGLFLFPSSQLILITGGILLMTNNLNYLFTILILIFGNVLGNYVLYLIANKYGEKVLHKILPMSKKKLADQLLVTKYLFKKHGGKIIIIGRNLPVLHSLISAPAGIARFSQKLFLIYTTIGITIWSITFFYVGILFQENYIVILEKFTMSLSTIFIVVCILLVISYKKYMKHMLILAKREELK